MSELMKQFGIFTVRILRKGEKYGLNDCLTHNEELPMIEFYDARHKDNQEWKRGQFISRYDSDTLLGETKPNRMLDLYGGEDEWTIYPDDLRRIYCWLYHQLPEYAPTAHMLADWNCYRSLEAPEADGLTNALARALIRKVHTDNKGTCYLGKWHQKKGLWKYKRGKVFNFGADFVLPEYNSEIDNLLRNGRILDNIEKLNELIKKNGGYTIFWS